MSDKKKLSDQLAELAQNNNFWWMDEYIDAAEALEAECALARRERDDARLALQETRDAMDKISQERGEQVKAWLAQVRTARREAFEKALAIVRDEYQEPGLVAAGAAIQALLDAE
jgi:uncharacterized coiled-coil DUF342 family protein